MKSYWISWGEFLIYQWFIVDTFWGTTRMFVLNLDLRDGNVLSLPRYDFKLFTIHIWNLSGLIIEDVRKGARNSILSIYAFIVSNNICFQFKIKSNFKRLNSIRKAFYMDVTFLVWSNNIRKWSNNSTLKKLHED